MTDEHIGTMISAAARTVQAPPELRERLSRPPRRSRRAPRFAFAGAAAAVLAAGILLVSGGGPTVQEVARAALQPPTRPVSPERAGWGAMRGGWRPVGERVDQVSGRRAVTAIYRKGARGVHYAILDGDPIDVPRGRSVNVGGHPYVLLHEGRTAIVTWRQGGHTCLVASTGVGADGLLDFLRG